MAYILCWGFVLWEWLGCAGALGCCPMFLAHWHFDITFWKKTHGPLLDLDCSRLDAGYGLEKNYHAVSLQGSGMEFPLSWEGSGTCSILCPCELVYGRVFQTHVSTCVFFLLYGSWTAPTCGHCVGNAHACSLQWLSVSARKGLSLLVH